MCAFEGLFSLDVLLYFVIFTHSFVFSFQNNKLLGYMLTWCDQTNTIYAFDKLKIIL